MPAILALGRLSQGDYELKASLDYIARRDLAILKKKKIHSQVLVAHTCNPSYSGDRDQEDHGLKPTQANSFHDPVLKKCITHTQKGLVEWLEV
jgi:hypothetical protein